MGYTEVDQLRSQVEGWIDLDASTLFGRGSAGGTGQGQQIDLGDGLSMSGTTLNVVPSSNVVNPQTGTTYTLQDSDNGILVTFDNALAVTVTVPAGLGAGFHTTCIQLGAGQVTFTPSSTTVNNAGGLNSIVGQWGRVTLDAYDADAFVLSGDVGP